MSANRKEDLQRFKREELERRKSASFFIFEMILLCIVSVLSILGLFGDYPFYVKTTCGGLLVYIVQSVIKHLTEKI